MFFPSPIKKDRTVVNKKQKNKNKKKKRKWPHSSFLTFLRQVLTAQCRHLKNAWHLNTSRMTRGHQQEHDQVLRTPLSSSGAPQPPIQPSSQSAHLHPSSRICALIPLVTQHQETQTFCWGRRGHQTGSLQGHILIRENSPPGCRASRLGGGCGMEEAWLVSWVRRRTQGGLQVLENTLGISPR